jgi:hypothetical protein
VADCPPEAEAAVEVNSPGAVEVEPPAEATFALGPLCEEGEGEEEAALSAARACSGPNSRLALAAAGSSASVSSAWLELEGLPRAGALSSGVGWVSAIEELRACCATAGPVS